MCESVNGLVHRRTLMTGNRDIVGFGFNGHPTYIDRAEFPMPAVRFKENTAEVLALRQKETGDWSKLSIDEKKERLFNYRRLKGMCGGGEILENIQF